MGRRVRHIANRISLALCLICVGALGVGIGIEVYAKTLLFDNYLSTFAGHAIVFGIIYWVTRQHHIECGLCHKCGYDLRASENRCPECGEPIRAEVPVPRQRW